jgi:fluoroacetyl-CoA thioesterase
MENFDDIRIGMTLTLQKKVGIDDTALHYGSGKVENLLATVRLVAFMIEASAQLIDPHLPEGYGSIGHHLEVDHFKPTMIGSTVTVEVKVSAFENGKYIITMRAYDEYGQIGTGKNTRSIVNLDKLMQKAEERERETIIEV